jgi:predicted SprT family Zn-dependent metalloprotease
MLPYEDRRRVLLWLRESLLLAEEKGVLNATQTNRIRSRLQLDWSTNMPRAMGKACYNKDDCWIRLSTILWAVSPEDQKRETVYHEMAHIIVAVRREDKTSSSTKKRQRRDVHGDEWRYVMHKIGYPNAERCHDVVNEEHEKAKGKVALYCKCPGSQPYWISFQRMVKRNYSCRKCKAALAPRLKF